MLFIFHFNLDSLFQLHTLDSYIMVSVSSAMDFVLVILVSESYGYCIEPVGQLITVYVTFDPVS